MNARSLILVIAGALAMATPLSGAAQSRLPSMPGYQRHQEMAGKIMTGLVSGAVTADWSEDSAAFTYDFDGQHYRFDVADLRAEPIDAEPKAARPPGPFAGNPRTSPVLARGRGGDVDVISPDGKWRARTHDGNIWLATEGGGEERPLTTDGGPFRRVRNGTASYVYIEELDMGPALWWSPDSRKIAFLRFDENGVDDFFVPMDQTRVLDRVHTEVYPSPGERNPEPELYVYDLASRTTTRMDVRGGTAFSDDVIGHYIWAVDWTRDSTRVLARRAPRSQKIIELAVCEAGSGACHTAAREARPQSWAEVEDPVFLDDGERFIWTTEANGFANLELRDLSGRRLARLTGHAFEVSKVVKVDEARGEVWYMARDGDNFMKQQLHRVRLDGTGDVRLTDPAFHHTVSVAPDGSMFVDTVQTHDTPPLSQLADRDGRVLALVARSDISKLDALGVKPAELFTFTAADGHTQLNGLLSFPSDFDPARTYPLLVSVYGGPETNGARETFTLPETLAEYGFIVLQADLRSAAGRGRAFSDVVYENLGVAEIDDLAAAVKAVARRPYVDGRRVGVFGTSYGGYASAMAILRYPDVFAAASVNSPVTDWRLYDSTYTERYMGLPGPNTRAYDRASVLTYAKNLKGALMIYYGTSDDNVHPKNALQLIQTLQRAGKSFEVQIGPDLGHTAVNRERMMEFFIDNLVIHPAP